MSEKFLRYYVTGSFVLIILLAAAIGVLYTHQQKMEENFTSQNDVIKGKIEDTQDSLGKVQEAASNAEDNSYEACREIKQSLFC